MGKCSLKTSDEKRANQSDANNSKMPRINFAGKNKYQKNFPFARVFFLHAVGNRAAA